MAKDIMKAELPLKKITQKIDEDEIDLDLFTQEYGEENRDNPESTR
jgi:hypothetical protein